MLIRVRHLSHSFGGIEVLHDVSFEVERATIFGFIGPNGAGKTTTIRAMASLLEPTSGRIEIAGVDVGLEPDRVRRSIGYMADQAGIYPKLTVDEYLAFFAAAHGLSPDRAVDAALELTQLTEVRNELAGTLSKGMRQRLQLAKTVLHDPQLLILDEPASDLDPRARIEMRDLFVRLRDAGKTVFLSSHILTELSDVCSSVAVLEKGHLLAYGPIADITRRLPSALPAQDPTHSSPYPVGPIPAVGTPPEEARGIKIRTLGAAEHAARALEGVPGLTVARAIGDQLVVRLSGGDPSIAHVVERLVYAGIGVVGIEPERHELERVFMELTERGKPDR
jgi:ABC-2 type transport system ATP-binding protein